MYFSYMQNPIQFGSADAMVLLLYVYLAEVSVKMDFCTHF